MDHSVSTPRRAKNIRKIHIHNTRAFSQGVQSQSWVSANIFGDHWSDSLCWEQQTRHLDGQWQYTSFSFCGLDGSTAKRDFSDFPTLRKWTKLEIKQVKEGSTYYVTISMNSKIISREINSKPKDEYNLVTISQHPGLIKSILIQHKNDWSIMQKKRKLQKKINKSNYLYKGL